MAIRNDASLRGKIRAIAKREGLRPQEVLQMFLFEHLLLRLEKTSYVDKFILKGGLLISSMIGVSLRTTRDMDTTVVVCLLIATLLSKRWGRSALLMSVTEWNTSSSGSSQSEKMTNIQIGVLILWSGMEE